MENASERNLGTLEALNTKHWPITKSLETRPNGVLQQNTKNKVLTNCINFIPVENIFLGHSNIKMLTTSILLQYCAKVTQAKCANFILCSCELSRKVRVKVRVTMRVLLSEISLEQTTLFRRTFGMKRNFTMISIVSLSQRLKFRIRQAQQFFTRSNRSARHITFAKYDYERFSTHSLIGVQSWTQRMRTKSKTYHKWRLWI